MSHITRFEIKALHGRKDVDLHLKDNTLILVGENGAGKTTILHLLYYLLSGQWPSIARYRFSELAITIGGTRYVLKYSDFAKSLDGLDRRLSRRLPPHVRRRFIALVEEKEGRLVTPELELLCHQYDIPLQFVLHEIEELSQATGKSAPIRKILEGIRDALTAQLLYLPTYRRIEQELHLIFKGMDERELRNRREMLSARRGDNTFVELIEFGMKDVERAISETLQQLNAFARERLNNLTFGYLGDVVEKQYSEVKLKSIKGAPDETVVRILDRIQDHILSSENKQHLREIIDGVKKGEAQTEHTKVICHYFAKLMEFHAELEAKEARIAAFCRVCNEYLVDKDFHYDTSKFSFSILPTSRVAEDVKIELHHLSSGEKQIVSLLSHLYLSGTDDYFVLIDEPELSLSVPWQRRFLLDIRNGGYCSGLVAVTHSPFIYDNELRKYAHGLGEFVT
ncbi:MAG: AAA family ATPase [Pirellulales bacterium]|nr:AAA family ATPase [Pirellulales bacterium]